MGISPALLFPPEHTKLQSFGCSIYGAFGPFHCTLDIREDIVAVVPRRMDRGTHLVRHRHVVFLCHTHLGRRFVVSNSCHGLRRVLTLVRHELSIAA